MKQMWCVLEDDKKLFPIYKVALMVRQETLEKYPGIRDAGDAVASLLTNEVIQQTIASLNHLCKHSGGSPLKPLHGNDFSKSQLHNSRTACYMRYVVSRGNRLRWLGNFCTDFDYKLYNRAGCLSNWLQEEIAPAGSASWPCRRRS